jgi:hypothetical protein
VCSREIWNVQLPERNTIKGIDMENIKRSNLFTIKSYETPTFLREEASNSESKNLRNNVSLPRVGRRNIMNLNAENMVKDLDDIVLDSEKNNPMSKFIGILQDQEVTICNLLSSFQDSSVTSYELKRTALAMKGMTVDSFKRESLGLRAASFLPLNLPIYSLFLFGIAPSFYCSSVSIRAPTVLTKIFPDVMKLLEIDTYFPQIELFLDERHQFVSRRVNTANVIVFTGKPENASLISQNIRNDALFVFNGWGCNPVVINKDADFKKAAEAVIGLKLFNGGQDCGGPDQILISSGSEKLFVDELISQLEDRCVLDLGSWILCLEIM